MHSINKIAIDIQEGAEFHNLFVFCPYGFIGYQMDNYLYNLITKRSQCFCGHITSGILLIALAIIGGCFSIIFQDFGVMLMAVIIVWGALLFNKKVDKT